MADEGAAGKIVNDANREELGEPIDLMSPQEPATREYTVERTRLVRDRDRVEASSEAEAIEKGFVGGRFSSETEDVQEVAVVDVQEIDG